MGAIKWNGMELSVGLLPLYDFNSIWFPKLSKSPLFSLSSSSSSFTLGIRCGPKLADVRRDFMFMDFFFWNITYKSKVVGVSEFVCDIHMKEKRSTKIFSFNLWFYLEYLRFNYTNSFCMLWIRLNMDLHKFPSKVWKWNVVDSALKFVYYFG